MAAKQKGVKLTPDQVARITEIARARPGGGVSFSQVIREAVDYLLGESPQAMDAYEMWLLRASRTARKNDPDGWAAAMRDFNGLLKHLGPNAAMEDWMYESLSSVSSEGGKQRARPKDRGDVRNPSDRREPKAR